GHRLGAAEEHRGMLELERFQAAKRRTLLPDRRYFARGAQRVGQLALDEPMQVLLQQLFEMPRGLERVERGDERPFGLVVEPARDEIVELLFLPQALEQLPQIGRASCRERGWSAGDDVA